MWLPVAADYSQVFSIASPLCCCHVRVTSAGGVSLETDQICERQYCQSGARRPVCLMFVSGLFISQRCPFILPLSLPPSLPHCRLNLCLFIACSSRAELWVSMLRGRRGCCCRVAHHNFHSFMSLRGKRWTVPTCKKKKKFGGNLQV